jgi:hypothetical protein
VLVLLINHLQKINPSPTIELIQQNTQKTNVMTLLDQFNGCGRVKKEGRKKKKKKRKRVAGRSLQI